MTCHDYKSDYIVFFSFFFSLSGVEHDISKSKVLRLRCLRPKQTTGTHGLLLRMPWLNFCALGLKVFERNRERIMKGIGVKMVRICWSGYSGHQNPCSICSMIHVCPGTLWRVHGAKTA